MLPHPPVVVVGGCSFVLVFFFFFILIYNITTLLVGTLKMQRRFVFKDKKVLVGKDQEKTQSEKDYDSKNRGGKKLN